MYLSCNQIGYEAFYQPHIIWHCLDAWKTIITNGNKYHGRVKERKKYLHKKMVVN